MKKTHLKEVPGAAILEALDFLKHVPILPTLRAQKTLIIYILDLDIIWRIQLILI